ncbi:MAG TPA: DUF3606 domain-containing protein [Burkholderiales bacterium]|nr:DUF3606 domain-containing protein [Burkholderiales bacterium]
MADAPTRYVPPDPTLIDAGTGEALRYWSKTLETDPEKIRQAVCKVGPILDDVKTELGIGGVG